MFSTNEYIIYGTTGICKIHEIRKMKFGNKPEKEYYIIKPVYNENCTIYAPVDNNELNIKRVMNMDEVQKLICDIPNQDIIWIDYVNSRKEKYTEIIKHGNRKDLVSIIKTLYLKKQEQIANGKKLMINDENFMKEAERILHEELALILDITPEEVVPFIIKELSC